MLFGALRGGWQPFAATDPVVRGLLVAGRLLEGVVAATSSSQQQAAALLTAAFVASGGSGGATDSGGGVGGSGGGSGAGGGSDAGSRRGYDPNTIESPALGGDSGRGDMALSDLDAFAIESSMFGAWALVMTVLFVLQNYWCYKRALPWIKHAFHRVGLLTSVVLTIISADAHGGMGVLPHEMVACLLNFVVALLMLMFSAWLRFTLDLWYKQARQETPQGYTAIFAFSAAHILTVPTLGAVAYATNNQRLNDAAYIVNLIVAWGQLLPAAYAFYKLRAIIMAFVRLADQHLQAQLLSLNAPRAAGPAANAATLTLGNGAGGTAVVPPGSAPGTASHGNGSGAPGSSAVATSPPNTAGSPSGAPAATTSHKTPVQPYPSQGANTALGGGGGGVVAGGPPGLRAAHHGHQIDTEQIKKGIRTLGIFLAVSAACIVWVSCFWVFYLHRDYAESDPAVDRDPTFNPARPIYLFPGWVSLTLCLWYSFEHRHPQTPKSAAELAAAAAHANNAVVEIPDDGAGDHYGHGAPDGAGDVYGPGYGGYGYGHGGNGFGNGAGQSHDGGDGIGRPIGAGGPYDDAQRRAAAAGWALGAKYTIDSGLPSGRQTMIVSSQHQPLRGSHVVSGGGGGGTPHVPRLQAARPPKKKVSQIAMSNKRHTVTSDGLGFYDPNDQ